MINSEHPPLGPLPGSRWESDAELTTRFLEAIRMQPNEPALGLIMSHMMAHGIDYVADRFAGLKRKLVWADPPAGSVDGSTAVARADRAIKAFLEYP